jgi:hypothetical protein
MQLLQWPHPPIPAQPIRTRHLIVSDPHILFQKHFSQLIHSLVEISISNSGRDNFIEFSIVESRIIVYTSLLGRNTSGRTSTILENLDSRRAPDLVHRVGVQQPHHDDFFDRRRSAHSCAAVVHIDLRASDKNKGQFVACASLADSGNHSWGNRGSLTHDEARHDSNQLRRGWL